MTVVTVLIESLKSTPVENLSTKNVVDVVYQKLQNGSTVENANEAIQEERKCDVKMKNDLSERQAPEASASVMNHFSHENPDAIIFKKENLKERWYLRHHPLREWFVQGAKTRSIVFAYK
jgi:hypothetical protein